MPVSCRQMLLLETLGVKMSFLEPIPGHLQLPIAVTCYWIRCSEPKVKLNQLKALLLMIVSGELQRITDDPGMSPRNTVLGIQRLQKSRP